MSTHLSTLSTIDLGGLPLSVMASGSPQVLSGTEVLLPPGAVTVLHPLSDPEFFRHGWNSWSPSGWRRLSEKPLRVYDSAERLLTADDARNDTPLSHSGSAVGALSLGGGEVLLLGALGLGAPRVGASGASLWGTVEVDAGEWFLGRGLEHEVFARYAELLAERLGSRSSRAGTVWCSWYSHYESLSEDIVAETLEGIEGLPFDVMQLDDGWEPMVGDWVANDRFPSGMAATAQRIREAGFRPGLWLAPFIALPGSSFATERPDLLIQSPAGGPLVTGYNWGGPYYSLDTTHPEVQQHLRELFTRVVDWGFGYLKLDFMYAAALEGVRFADVHREQAYRDAVALIRETVGDDTYLLGCGVPILPSAGIFDGVRVGPDVAAYWDNAERPGDPTGVGTKNAFLASIHRSWLRAVFETDPDVVYFRRRRSMLDEPQRQLLHDVAAILRFKSTSDLASWLDDAERAELAAWLQRDEPVRQVGRYSFEVGDRMIDLSSFVTGYQPHPSTMA